jgi:hypothetical protein
MVAMAVRVEGRRRRRRRRGLGLSMHHGGGRHAVAAIRVTAGAADG